MTVDYIILRSSSKSINFFEPQLPHQKLWFRSVLEPSPNSSFIAKEIRGTRSSQSLMRMEEKRSKHIFVRNSYLFIEQRNERYLWEQVVPKGERFCHITGIFVF